MDKMLKIFSKTFSYPENSFFYYLNSLIENLTELDNEVIKNKIKTIQKLTKEYSLSTFEEIYSQSFDWNSSQSLYLGYYLFGETYFRSNFLSNLLDIFKKFNYKPNVSDLPDHLAILLDFTASAIIGSEQKEFIETILITAIDKMIHISIPQNNKNLPQSSTNNPYHLLIEILFEFLSMYCAEEVIITTI